MYGAQTSKGRMVKDHEFENDVEMYGAQTNASGNVIDLMFENDVEMYGAQTGLWCLHLCHSLRMMQKCMVLKLLFV